jgi:predicted Rossmann fold nucleotide-binding protein DprA/Smf involved in DNA uptake
MRNRTVVALSDAVVAFEPRDCGGTWHTCLTALRLRRALFVVTADRRGAKGRGLKLLVRAGAVALDPGRMPEGDALALLVADYRVPRAASQLPLFRQE